MKEDVRPSTMGPVAAVMLSYSLHKTYHQRIALYCAAYLCLCSLSFVHTLATRTKTMKELLQLNWSIIDHYYLHCYPRWSMAPVLMTTSILQDIIGTKQIITDAKLPRCKQSTCILRNCERVQRGEGLGEGLGGGRGYYALLAL